MSAGADLAVDIVIDNYNYARYLPAAIESALRQTHEKVTVTVVDDGSSDGSQRLLDSYEDRVAVVRKENGGQASALNAGAELCGGDVVIFLDADDTLHPEAVAEVAAAFAADPEVVKVQFRTAVIDAAGESTGAIKPAPHLPMPSGDLRQAELASPYDLVWMATSANAFRADALRRVLPIPEAKFRTCADWYLVHLTALIGPVVSLDSVAGSYRVHGANNYEPQGPELDLGHLRETIGFADSVSPLLLGLAAELGLPRPARILSIADLANRMISLRLEPDRHPDPEESAAGLLADAVRAARRRANVPAPMKAIFVAWFAAMAVAPRPFARRLAILVPLPRAAPHSQPPARPPPRRRAARDQRLTMRVLLVTSMVPDAGGVGAIPKLLAAQLQGLRERGHEITLVTTFGEDPGQAEAAARLLDSDLDAHILDRRRSPSARRRWRVRAELAASWASKHWPWRVVSGAAGMQTLIDRVAATRGFDVVAIEDNPMAVLRFPPAVPVVFTEHEAIRAPASQLGAVRLSERPLRALRARDWQRWDGFLPSIWKRFELLQVFCEADAAEIRKLAPELAPRIRINPYGMILPEPCDPLAELPGTVLFTGTFAHLPNRDAARWLASEIMPAVRARHPQARLRIVGSAPPADVLALAGEGVEVIADAPSMQPHLEAAAVVVAPVRSGGGMRMKVLEAMARRKAVVTTSLGAEGFASLEPQLPLLIVDEAEGVAAAIADLLGEADERRALGLDARRFAERHHSPAAWAQRLESIYDEARDR